MTSASTYCDADGERERERERERRMSQSVIVHAHALYHGFVAPLLSIYIAPLNGPARSIMARRHAISAVIDVIIYIRTPPGLHSGKFETTDTIYQQVANSYSEILHM